MGNRMERQEKKNSGDGKQAKAKFDWKLLPDVLALIKPRRGILALGFGLMVINRVSGLVLPASTKYFLDDVILKRQARLLPLIVLVVVTATVIQGLTSYALTQLLSKSSWRMISELREKVQAHIGRLPVSFYDANKTGVLISRIMSDVEGVRNLIGTGLVEFAGGIMTALFALVYLLRTSASMTAVAFVVLLIFGVTLNRAFKTIRPIFRARPKINAEVTGRLTESIGGVRVVKGYHAETREEKVFGAGVQRLLDNVLQTLTATSLMSLSATSLMGIVSALIMLLGARQILAGTMTPGAFFSYTMFLGFLIAPVFQIVAIGPQITEALAGLERTREVLNENPEDEDPNRRESLERIRGEVIFEDVSFSYDTGKEVLHQIAFHSQPGTVTALVFVEVKARVRVDDAAEAVTERGRQRIIAAAELWLAHHPDDAEREIRFDVILVAPGRMPRHIPDAFDATR
jgi:subfamily B ATP-binding cassette protein MsbA